jgi:hypothetical protein
MAWQISLLYWLSHAAVSAFLLLAAGCLAMWLCRQPVRRLRLAELTLLGCLLAPALQLVPGLPHYTLGWLQAVPEESAVTVGERPASAGCGPPLSC